MHEAEDGADAAVLEACHPPTLDALSIKRDCQSHGYAIAEYRDMDVYRVTCTEYSAATFECLHETTWEGGSSDTCVAMTYTGACTGSDAGADRAIGAACGKSEWSSACL